MVTPHFLSRYNDSYWGGGDHAYKWPYTTQKNGS